MLPRDRIEALIDPDTPMLELSPLAGWGSEFPVGAGAVNAIGVVEGVECAITASDMTYRGGSMNPRSVDKGERLRQIIRQNRLPWINLTESAGADLPHQADIFIRGGAGFRDQTQFSKLGIPTITVGVRPEHRGGAYVPGMSDYTIFVKDRGTAYLGGPPLVKMAIDEIVDEETLGGADMHTRISGLGDYLAADEMDALRITRDIVRHLRWRKLGPGPTESADEPALRPCRADRVRIRRRARPVRHPRDLRPRPRRIPVRGVQAAVRRQARVRVGIDPRLPDRRARQQRDPVLGGGAKGRPVHSALQQDRHAARLLPQHHRVHGRVEGRTGRHHPQRRQDDQRRLQQRGAALLPHGRSLVRCRQLRDGRQGIQPPIHLLVAEPQDRSDGWPSTRRSDGHRGAQRRCWQRDRRRRGRSHARKDALEAQIESESSALYSTGRVWDDGIIHPERQPDGARVSRSPQLTTTSFAVPPTSACGGTDAENRDPSRSRTVGRSPCASRAPRADSAWRRSACTPNPTATRSTATPSIVPSHSVVRARPSRTSAATRSSKRRWRPEPMPSIPATASSRRMPTSPRRSWKPA